MRVLLVNDYATPTAGAERMTLTLRDGLRQRGHQARVFASRAQLIAGPSFADYHCYGTTSRLQVLVQLANPSAYGQLRHALAAFKPDVVHVRMFLWQLSPLILPLLRDVPSIYHIVTYKPICPTGSKMLPDGRSCQERPGRVCLRNHCVTGRSWLPLLLQLKLWRRWQGVFDRIITNSQAVARRLAADGIEPVEVVWNGVPVRPPRPPLSAPPTVVFAGRLVPEKGADVLVQAFVEVARQVPEAQLLVAGEGPEAPRLRDQVADLGLTARVRLLGQLSPAELERRFAAAWIQVVPSRWAEPFGIVAAEALMRGTAVVASNQGGLAEIVEPGLTGWLVPAGDASALAGALLSGLRDRARTEEMGRAGRAVALDRFNADTYIERLVGLYEQISISSSRRADDA